MTKKETLQAEYERIFGMAPDDSMTIKYLEEALKDTVFKEDEPIQEVKSNLTQITNGRITKNVTARQWRNMQAFRHEWKQKVNEPIEVKKLKDNGKIKK